MWEWVSFVVADAPALIQWTVFDRPTTNLVIAMAAGGYSPLALVKSDGPFGPLRPK